MIDPPIIWRTKLRSLKPGVDHAKQVAYCIDGGLVGIGWGVEDLPTGTPLADVVAAIRAKKEPGWGPQAASTVRLFGEEAKVNDFIWTRDLEGRFRLAQIAGDYRYDNSAKARETDTHQVRKVKWAQRPLGDLEVPGAIIRAFSGTSTSFSRMWNTGARIYTAWIWEKLHGREPPRLEFSPAEVLVQLEPYDLEDLIYTWMQVSGGYLALPKARRTDTPAYEWTMLHRETYSPAIVQVKSGAQGVDLEALAAAAPSEQTMLFAYSAAGIYTNSPSRPVSCIETSDLLAFVAEHSKLLPPRVRTWFELAQTDGGESPPESM
jgi:hypothetical protein